MKLPEYLCPNFQRKKPFQTQRRITTFLEFLHDSKYLSIAFIFEWQFDWIEVFVSFCFLSRTLKFGSLVNNR